MGLNSTVATYRSPVELLQNLIRFNTSNPPGNEKECISYINEVLCASGISTTVLARDEGRPNLIARLPGRGDATPLLLYGHVDVVPTKYEAWQYPPFEGKVIDGYVWGRGALDMKSGVAMILAALLRVKSEGLIPPGDVILAVVSDEEMGGNFGAKYLVENHANQFEGVRYAIGEFGGFSMNSGRKKFFPIMVAEKQPCILKLTVSGPSGHATMASHGGAMAKLGKALQKIDSKRSPVHVTQVTRQMIKTMSGVLPFPDGLLIRQLLNVKIADAVLDLLGEQAEQFEPLLHNNVNPMYIHMPNFGTRIPSKIELYLACNLLPGFSPEDAVAELYSIVGKDAELEVVDRSWCERVPAKTDMGLFDLLVGILREAEPEGVPMPLLLSSPTDGRLFSRLGIQTYGFLPMNLPPDFKFWQLVHEANERIPVEALAFGSNILYEVMQRF